MTRVYSSNSKHKYPPPPQQPTRFPQDIDVIVKSTHPSKGSIFISNVEAAQNPQTLKKHRIGAVLTCAKGYQLSHQKHIVPGYKYIPGIDHQSYDLSVYFQEAVDFIQKHVSETNVLVHCIAGVSRSVSMVIAYFIREKGMSFEEAYRKVRSQRSIMNPNSSFVQQLKQFARQVEDKRQSQKDKQRAKSRSLEKDRYYEKMYTPQKDEKRTAGTASFSQSKPSPSPPLYTNSTSKYQNQLYPPPLRASAQRFAMTPDVRTKTTRSNYQRSIVKSNTRLLEQKDVQKTLKRQSYLRNKQQNYSAGYFLSLNADLQAKIEQIKKKYDIEREQLHDKYHVFGQHAKKDTIIGRGYDRDYSQLNRMKTQNSRGGQTGEKYNSYQRDVNIENLFPKKFYLDKFRQQTDLPRTTTSPARSPMNTITVKYPNNELNRPKKADLLLSKRQDMPKSYQKMYTGYGASSFVNRNYH